MEHPNHRKTTLIAVVVDPERLHPVVENWQILPTSVSKTVHPVEGLGPDEWMDVRCARIRFSWLLCMMNECVCHDSLSVGSATQRTSVFNTPKKDSHMTTQQDVSRTLHYHIFSLLTVRNHDTISL